MDVWDIDWKKFGTDRCSIYVIASEGTWPVKIGVAVYPVKRLAGLQTSHWKKLELVRAVWCHTFQDAYAVEQKAHAILREEDRGLMGEWFDRSPAQALDVIQFAAMLLGVELFDTVPKDAEDFMRERNRKADLKKHFARYDRVKKELFG